MQGFLFKHYYNDPMILSEIENLLCYSNEGLLRVPIYGSLPEFFRPQIAYFNRSQDF